MIIAGLVVLALVVVGLFAFAGSRANSNVPGEDVAKTSPSASDSPSPSASATIPVAPANPEEAKKEIEESRSFEKATEIEGFSKEEVQEALKTATEYSYNTLTNRYYLSGEWDEAKMPNNLEPAVGRFFTNNLRKSISEIDTNPETGKDIGTKVFPLMFFVRPNGNIAPNEVCRTDFKGETAIACPMDGLTFTDMKYVPTMEDDTPGIRVTFSTTTKVPVKIDGTKDGFTTVRYDYDLNFVRNSEFEETVNPNKFVINWYNVQANMSAVEEIK
jgi:hypothetical protein